MKIDKNLYLGLAIGNGIFLLWLIFCLSSNASSQIGISILIYSIGVWLLTKFPSIPLPPFIQAIFGRLQYMKTKGEEPLQGEGPLGLLFSIVIILFVVGIIGPMMFLIWGLYKFFT